MLQALGKKSTEELFEAIPSSLLNPKLDLPPGLSEKEALSTVLTWAKKNTSQKEFRSFLGAGCYPHYIPQAVQAILQRGEFTTAYTPYQPEASQGTLQVIFEFQSLVCELVQLEVANASMYDGASALAEAVLMAKKIGGKGKRDLLVPASCHPFHRKTLDAYLTAQEIPMKTIPYNPESGTIQLEALEEASRNAFAAILQTPNFFGVLEDGPAIRKLLPDLLLIASVHPLSCALFTPPGEYGADIACGDLQPLGLPTSYGGPSLGFLSCKLEYLRQMPGRIVSETKDTEGKRGFVLTLQTREQHIRREKATSNICTNHQLNALAVCAYCGLLGGEGLVARAKKCLENLTLFEKLLEQEGVSPRFSAPKFCETVVPIKKDDLTPFLEKGIFPGVELSPFFPELTPSLLVYLSDELKEEDLHAWISIYKTLSP